jgi:hypothetical protein
VPLLSRRELVSLPVPEREEQEQVPVSEQAQEPVQEQGALPA